MNNIENEYKQWLIDLKKRIRQSQIKAAVKVNAELLRFYWDLGCDIVVRQMEADWGTRFFEQLSKDLRKEFPNMKGFSSTNLKYTKRFYLFYTQDNSIRQQLADEILHQVGEELQTVDNKNNIIRPQVVDEFENHPIFQIPWFHHVQIFTKCQTVHEALFYVQKTISNGWSRAVLMNFIEADLYSAQGKSLNNFSRLLPDAQSDLASEIIKDPYNFDFLTLTEDYKEKELEDALIDNITKFLLELGQGFAYIGRQLPVKIGKKERFIDLLFYHTELHCYVVIELKTREFEAEYAGKLGLYVSAINHQRKKENDNPTIGLMICKTKDNVEVQYSLEIINQPIGVSEYKLSKLLPETFKSALPSIEDIEKRLKDTETNNKSRH
ncbi:MAG: PDDEXK nuclease domain-containing protein [Lentimicrobiaceae bacterium]|nr:PDDEXK nuclease domain-containing protein [Lentimicrobiaceae bacterium]